MNAWHVLYYYAIMHLGCGKLALIVEFPEFFWHFLEVEGSEV